MQRLTFIDPSSNVLTWDVPFDLSLESILLDCLSEIAVRIQFLASIMEYTVKRCINIEQISNWSKIVPI